MYVIETRNDGGTWQTHDEYVFVDTCAYHWDLLVGRTESLDRIAERLADREVLTGRTRTGERDARVRNEAVDPERDTPQDPYAVHGVLTVNAGDVGVAFHCEHDNDIASYKVTGGVDQIDVYLRGTPEQLGAFCDRIMRAVSAHTIAQVEAATS